MKYIFLLLNFCLSSIVLAQCPLQPTISANIETINCGGSVTLTATGCTGILTWDTGATTNTITVTPNTTSTYTATCSNNNCNVSESVEIKVKPTTNIVKIWDKRYGGSSGNNPVQLHQTADGGMLMGGTVYGSTGGDISSGQSKTGYWLIKTDADGNKVFDRFYTGGYGGSCGTLLYRFLEDTDGSTILIGSSNCPLGLDKSENPKTYSGSFANYDVWIINSPLRKL